MSLKARIAEAKLCLSRGCDTEALTATIKGITKLRDGPVNNIANTPLRHALDELLTMAFCLARDGDLETYIRANGPKHCHFIVDKAPFVAIIRELLDHEGAEGFSAGVRERAEALLK